jgi:phosphatidylinositol alpha 1,6-mannosyltransferase
VQPKDLRIALFSGNYNYVSDGANQALNRLVGFLEGQGVSVRIYSPTTDEPAFPAVGTVVSVPSLALPGRGEYRAALGLPRKIRADIRGYNPNLFHVAAPDFLGHRAVTAARQRGTPCVATVHTRFETYFRYYRLGWAQSVGEAILRRFYRRCAEIYAPSESMAEVLRAQGMSDNIHIWSRGVDQSHFNPARRDGEWRRSLGIGPEEPVIAFVGRLVLEKGLDVFSATIAELERRGLHHRVLVVGEGPARAWLECRLPRATFVGFQCGEALARAYASADVLFNPSITETFGNVTLEAMASGLPVVAARATGSMSLVEDGRSGRLVTPGDATAFADSLTPYLKDPDARAHAGRQGRALSRRYSWDEINGRLLERYLRVVRLAGSRQQVSPLGRLVSASAGRHAA